MFERHSHVSTKGESVCYLTLGERGNTAWTFCQFITMKTHVDKH